MNLFIGTKLGRYEIRSKIGEGGMGEVYLAEDIRLYRKVALKILPANVAADRSRMSRFVQEAQAASALNHPNILTIHEIDEADSVHFIATEFIDGETLRVRMRNAPPKLSDVLDVTAQIASALSAAHAADIVHRDIKPGCSDTVTMRPLPSASQATRPIFIASHRRGVLVVLLIVAGAIALAAYKFTGDRSLIIDSIAVLPFENRAATSTRSHD